jgi:hypothetical protein
VTQIKAKSLAISQKVPLGQISLLVIIINLLFLSLTVAPVSAQNNSLFDGPWLVHTEDWQLECKQSGSTVHCDAINPRFNITGATIDGEVSGGIMIGTYADSWGNRYIQMRHVVRTTDEGLNKEYLLACFDEWFDECYRTGVYHGFEVERPYDYEASPPTYDDPLEDEFDEIEEPVNYPPMVNCMDRSCEETDCEDDFFYTLQTGLLDLESNTCIINSPEKSTFSCGIQGGDTEYYECDYVTNTCAYGFVVPCEYGCDETTSRCLQYIEDDPDNIILPPEPLDDCDGGCPYAICQGETSYYGSPECRDGICYYEISEYCPLGCNTSTGYCLKGSIERGSDIDQLVLLLGVAGGGSALIGGGLLGGGLLGLRALRGGRILLRNPNPAPPIEMDSITKGLNQTRQRVDELLEQLKARERQHLQDNLDHSVKMMESYHRTAARTETIELLPRAIGWAAGKAADYVGMLPAGKPFKYGYKFVTKTIEEGIEKGVGTGILEGLKEVGSDAIGDKIGDLVKVKDVKDIADFSLKTSVKAALKETGVKTIGKNIIKDKAVGSGIEDAKGVFDSLFGQN